jgi:cytochrome c553
MSTLILVGRVTRSTPDDVTVWAIGEEHEFRWGSRTLGRVVTAAVTPDDLVLVEARDGELRHVELVLSAPAGTGARLELEEPAADEARVRAGLCASCHEAGFVTVGPDELPALTEQGRVLAEILELPADPTAADCWERYESAADVIELRGAGES